MKSKILIIFVALLVGSSFAQRQKFAQTGFKFLSITYDARISGMGGSSVALQGNSTSLFHNPASMASITNVTSIAFGQYNAIADFKYQYFSMAFAPENGLFGVFGISYAGADYGVFKGTARADNVQGYIDTGEFSPENYALGFGYAKSLSDKFSVGGQIKYGYQNLSGGPIQFDATGDFDVNEYDVDVFAYDFGLLYKTGYKSIAIGMFLRNFSAEKKFISEKFQLPLVFEIGISADLNEFINMDKENHSLLMALDNTHPRDSYEAVNMGLEYAFRKTFFVRAGIVTPADEEGLSFGVGFAQNVFGVDLAIDYAYTNFGVFGDVSRFGFNIAY